MDILTAHAVSGPNPQVVQGSIVFNLCTMRFIYCTSCLIPTETMLGRVKYVFIDYNYEGVKSGLESRMQGNFTLKLFPF